MADHIMKIWIDFSTAPDPLFFRPLIRRFNEQGHETWLTAREFSETTKIAQQCGLSVEIVGRHGGSTLVGKSTAIFTRACRLASRARREGIDIALGFNSYAQALAAFLTRIPLATCMDYEYQPANHLAFRLASRIIVPRGFDAVVLRRQGGAKEKIVYHDGLKEHVTLADFQPDPSFPASLAAAGIDCSDILITVRPPATWSAYHRFDNLLFEEVVRHMASQPQAKVILLPRYPAQANHYRSLNITNMIIPERVLDGLNLVYCSDLVISAGGSMNREAVVLGVPVYTVFKGKMAGVDRKLIADGVLGVIRSVDELKQVRVTKRMRPASSLIGQDILNQVVDGVLGTPGLRGEAVI
jgi:predicted glycosyltransferase